MGCVTAIPDKALAGLVGGLSLPGGRCHRARSTSRVGHAVVGVLALIGAGVRAAAMFDGVYAITCGILFGSWAIAGIVGGRLAEPRGLHTAASWMAAAVSALLGVAALLPMWDIGGPILALIAGGVLATIALVVAVSIKPTY